MNKGQAELVRLIISHMTQQKLAAIQDKTAFNDLKHLLMEHLRKQCQPIPVNSMSKTLLRAVEQVVKGLPVNI
jgi:dsRNA-specific ribonuclease